MIPFHGTRFSGSDRVMIEALQGRHACVSFVDPSPISIVAEVCQSFIVDSGAYSVWRRGGRIDLHGFAAFLEQWAFHPAFDFYLIPDVIDGTEHDNHVIRAQWHSIAPAAIRRRGVPVWHLNESLDELRTLMNAYPRVALGSSGVFANPGSAPWWGRMHEALTVLCDEHGRPLVPIHGLRMLDPSITSHVPFSSADSTRVARNIGIDSAWKTGAYTRGLTKEDRAILMMSRIDKHAVAQRWNGTGGGRNLELFG